MNETYYEEACRVINEVKKAITGKDSCVRLAMAAILAGGHILIDDIPGVGKTTLAMSFARAMKLESCRIQFTPDVLPSDILGFSIYHKDRGTFEYKPGAVMCNLFLADEINRTSPKTQSALLEVMEENSVTVEGVTRPVPEPFVVIATENPVGSVGTQLLPESQLDRFMICITMGYPDRENEINIARGQSSGMSLQQINGIISAEELTELKQYVNGIYLEDDLYSYIVELVHATREHELLELGLSPRGTIAIVQMARAWAFLENRDYVVPDDVGQIFYSTAGHRVVLNAKGRVGRVSVRDILGQILRDVRKPTIRNRKMA